MSVAGNRPGGLTALAVLNFIIGGFALLQVLGLASANAEDPKFLENFPGKPPAAFIYAMLLVSLLSGALLIASGAGYLKLKYFQGKVLGTCAALLSLLWTALSIALSYAEFNMATMSGLVYPLLTLFLLYTTFRDDFAAD